MAEYIFNEVIIDPTIEKAKSCIGKDVYASDYPTCCLEYANENNKLAIQKLIGIFPDMDRPFKVSNGCSHYVTCIIPKKEDLKPWYVPFESAEEFLDAYFNTESRSKIATKKVSGWGIWLKRKCDSIWISQCTDISDHGIALGLDRKFMVWKELLDDYEFINGTPCGKIK